MGFMLVCARARQEGAYKAQISAQGFDVEGAFASGVQAFGRCAVGFRI